MIKRTMIRSSGQIGKVSACVNTMGGTQYWGLEHVAKIFDQEIGRGRWEVVEANYRLLSLT